ncbi:uncharacterized protein BDV17DRAFT_265742 [Aspergillus undulatus]|uniref:uncharacterized protein n=1 Tax=Aspergillus undulatus TaxID=1810928 RepID=UPI003CCDD0C0
MKYPSMQDLEDLRVWDEYVTLVESKLPEQEQDHTRRTSISTELEALPEFLGLPHHFFTRARRSNFIYVAPSLVFLSCVANVRTRPAATRSQCRMHPAWVRTAISQTLSIQLEYGMSFMRKNTEKSFRLSFSHWTTISTLVSAPAIKMDGTMEWGWFCHHRMAIRLGPGRRRG